MRQTFGQSACGRSLPSVAPRRQSIHGQVPMAHKYRDVMPMKWYNKLIKNVGHMCVVSQ
ncbi:MAG: hypothetical protein WA125_07620 [Desulfosporosinus sp.]